MHKHGGGPLIRCRDHANCLWRRAASEGKRSWGMGAERRGQLTEGPHIAFTNRMDVTNLLIDLPHCGLSQLSLYWQAHLWTVIRQWFLLTKWFAKVISMPCCQMPPKKKPKTSSFSSWRTTPNVEIHPPPKKTVAFQNENYQGYLKIISGVKWLDCHNVIHVVWLHEQAWYFALAGARQFPISKGRAP